MLGQPMSMLIPQVLGFKLHGELPEGATATDLVLTVTELLRQKGVVGKFVEFYGPASRTCRSPTARRSATCPPSSARRARSSRSTPRRCATCVHRAPEGADRPRRGLRQGAGPLARRTTARSRRSPTRRARPRRRRAVARRPQAPAGPRPADRRQGRVPAALADIVGADADEIADAHDEAVAETLPGLRSDRQRRRPATSRRPARRRRAPRPAATASPSASPTAVDVTLDDGTEFELDHGHVVIAAITSCTNTSNPSVMLGRGAARPQRVATRADAQAVGQDLAGARARRSSPSTSTAPG